MHARAGPRRQGERAPLDLEPGERIVEQTIELSKLARIVHARERASQMERLRGQEAAADGGSEPILDLAGLADARSGERVAQAPELGNLEADRIDGALGDELEYLA